MSYDGKDFDDMQEPQDIPFDRIVHETNNSWLLDIDKPAAVWFPKSQCGLEMDTTGKNTGGTIYVPYWLAREKGLI